MIPAWQRTHTRVARFAKSQFQVIGGPTTGQLTVTGWSIRHSGRQLPSTSAFAAQTSSARTCAD
jgi:hypothetical protein